MKRIVIAGGGTAGWMAAIAIASRFPEKEVTVIDPKSVGPIGVDESVTGVVLEFVGDPIHRLSRGEFVRRCDVTFKTGIWFKDWHGPGTEYLGPIDTPSQYFKHRYATQTEDFYAFAAAEGSSLGEVQIYSNLMRTNRTDYLRNADGSVNGQMASSSCHFDALKFAAWLSETASRRHNIRHLDDSIESFEQEAVSGHVLKVRTKEGREVEGDFFLDCTGFHRLLFAKVYQPRWKSYADYIRVDSAIPRFVDYSPGEVIPTYTQATAMPHGWMWQIPTQSRFGKGYIFSSRYVSDEQALAEFRAAGVDAGESPRILRFAPGRFERLWEGNVCTIGLSGVFSEPLEASTIHGLSVQIRLLTDLILPFLTREAMQPMADQYNKLLTVAYDDYVDFISLHYHTGRADTEFWRDYQRPEAVTPANQARLEKWRHAFPCREDFTPTYTQLAGLTTGLVIWAPMLSGFSLFRKDHAQRHLEVCRHRAELKGNLERYVQVRNQVAATALTHAESIEYCRGLA